MYYPDEVIEEVRSRSDIVDVISTYVKLKRQGSNYFGLCPFHNEKSGSFSVSPGKQMYYCFGCGAGGNVVTFIMQYENYSFPEAIKYLADRAGVKLPEQEQSPEAKKAHDLRSKILEINKMAGTYYYLQLRQPSGQIGMDYLKGRELSDETLKNFGLGYAGKYSYGLYRFLKSKGISDQLLRESGLMSFDEHTGRMYDKFWNRVMFPIMDINNRIIGFGGRVMGDGKPKYLNSPETKVFDKSRNLYGLNIARSSRKKFLIVCEGYMDVISMHQAGFTNAVASLGTALTSQHCSLLKRYTNEVILSYDSDAAGVKAALRAIPLVKEAGLTAKILRLEPCKDPDEFIKTYGQEAFEERLENAQNSFFFEVEVMEREHDMKDPEDKTAFFREVADKIAKFELEVERENYIEAVADKYHTSFEGLRDMVMRAIMAGSDVKPRAQVKTIREQQMPGKEDGILKSERLLLTWLTEYPKFYNTLKNYIKPEDFSTPFYKEAAELLYAQLESGKLQPAAIIDHFEDAEQQRDAAELFNTTVHLETKDEQITAMRETIRKVMQASIAAKAAQADSIEALQARLNAKRALEKMGQIRIDIDD